MKAAECAAKNEKWLDTGNSDVPAISGQVAVSRSWHMPRSPRDIGDQTS
jgi:hypothetical protein